jgi:DNA-binding beta-propeller fold protein YncE
MHSPVYVAVSRANGDVFVTDRGSNQVYQYNSNGKFVGTVKPDGTKAWGPLGISVAVDGTLYVGDANADPQRVWHLKPDGSVISVFGLKDKLSFPNGIAVYSDGTLVISDSNNSRVLVYNADGSLRGLLARGTADAPLGMPRGVTIGAGDRLYIADTINDVVRIFKPGSLPEYAVSFGEPGQLDGQMNYPNAVATDDHGHIFVADRENNRVQVWTNR